MITPIRMAKNEYIRDYKKKNTYSNSNEFFLNCLNVFIQQFDLDLLSRFELNFESNIRENNIRVERYLNFILSIDNFKPLLLDFYETYKNSLEFNRMSVYYVNSEFLEKFAIILTKKIGSYDLKKLKKCMNIKPISEPNF